MSSGWTQTKILLGGFVDLLACKKCKRIPEMPMRYINCGHFFCDVCIFSQNICFECHTPVLPREIKPYELVTKLLGYCNVVINVITNTKSENLKSLAAAVHQFTAECNGVVPETDSDSEDEVVESTPPGGRSKRASNREDENTEIETSEECQRMERRRQETGGKIVAVEPETKGFVSPTQFSPHQRKSIGRPETEEFLDGTASSSQHEGGKTVQPETRGFVSPTQFSPHQKKMFFQAETKGFVSPSQRFSLQRKKIVQPETAGFVEPTQLSPHQGKAIEKPEIARFPDKPRRSSHQGKKNLQGKTAGPVSPPRPSQRRKEKKTQPETVGFVSPTQCSPRRKQKSGQQENNAEVETAGFVDPTQFSPRHRKTNAEPETAGFVDPTQFSQRQRKQHSQADAKEPANSTDRNKNYIEQELEPETIGYCDKTLTPPGRKKMKLSIKTRKFPSRDSGIQNKNENATSESPRNHRSEFSDNSPRGNLEKICSRLNIVARNGGLSQKKQSRDRNATLTESTDFVDPTQFEKGGSGSLPPETEGYRDPSQSPVRSAMRKLAKSCRAPDSKLIDERPKNIESRDRITDSSDEMDFVEEPVEVGKKLSRSNEDLLAPESADLDETVCRNLTIPETLENDENSTNYQNVPMEIEHIIEKTILSKHPAAKSIGTKSSKTDSSKRTISKVQDDSMEFLETGEESPVHKLKRMKSSAPSRRSQNSKTAQVLDSFSETPEARKNKSQEKINIDENIVLDCCRKNSCIQDFDTLAIGQTINERIDEMVEKTLTKRSRRPKSVLSVEEQKESPTNVSTAKEISTNEKAGARKKTMKNSPMEKRRSEENRESESHGLEKNVKSIETPGETTCPRTREKLDKENLDATPKQNVKNKSVEAKARQSVDKPKTPTPKPIPKNINKRNAKGETPLHTACVKGHKDYVKMLLEAGANPNTKDNANWTPLQEAVNLGHREICEMLLQAGASANTPAMENRTALHDAAAYDKLEEAALLLRFKANRNVYDKFGKKPIDYAISDEMRVLLSGRNENEKAIKDDPSDDSLLDQSIIIPNSKVVVLPSNLNTKNRKLLAQLAPKLKVEVATTFRSTVTHVVVETNDRNITELTYNVMLAILQGKWILNSQWITISSELSNIWEIDLELFEVLGAPHPVTPTRARRNEENQNPRLFNNCYFYFAIGQRSTWSYEKFEFTKESLTTLVLGGQGEILHREPDPEVVKDYKLTPFHVAHKPIHPLYKCSHYIIYMPGKDEPRVKYNMPHIKSLPVGWFLECIEKFTLVDPILMGIS